MAERRLNDQLAMNPSYLDGVLALQVLLSQNLKVSVYSRQVVVAQEANAVDGEDSGLPRLAFVHGIPDTTILTSAVTVQNKRMRRAMLEQKKIPVPKGANFSVGRGIALSKTFAKQIKFPVVIKPSKGDVGFYNFTNVRNLRQMNGVIKKIKVPVHEREGLFRAAYTPMELGIPLEENGRQIVSKGYRFMVEKRVNGELLRFFVSEGKVLSAVQCEGSTIDGMLKSAVEVLDTIHPQLIRAVERASEAIPGLAVASIDVVATAPTRPLAEQEYWVVDFSERPLLWVQAKSDFRHARALAERMIADYLAIRGYPFEPCLDEEEVGFQIHALPSASTSYEALKEIVSQLDIRCEITEVADFEGRISGTFTGSSFHIAVLINGLTNEEFEDIPAMAVDVFPTDEAGSEGEL